MLHYYPGTVYPVSGSDREPFRVFNRCRDLSFKKTGTDGKRRSNIKAGTAYNSNFLHKKYR